MEIVQFTKAAIETTTAIPLLLSFLFLSLFFSYAIPVYTVHTRVYNYPCSRFSSIVRAGRTSANVFYFRRFVFCVRARRRKKTEAARERRTEKERASEERWDGEAGVREIGRERAVSVCQAFCREYSNLLFAICFRWSMDLSSL